MGRQPSVCQAHRLIEIDRATESLGTITRKGQRHLGYDRSGAARRTHGVRPRVLWTVPDEQRAGRVREALDQLAREAG